MTDSILSLLIVQNQSIIHGYLMESGRGSVGGGREGLTIPINCLKEGSSSHVFI